MTDKTEGGCSLAPHSRQPIEGTSDQALRDPLTLPGGFSADDPSVSELAAFRRQAIDLKAAARRAKDLDNEEFRLWLARKLGDEIQNRACSGLQIMSLAFAALTAIWPADHLDQAEAKLALAEHSGARLGSREPDFVSMMDAELVRRLRWKRTAFTVPGLMLPPRRRRRGPEIAASRNGRSNASTSSPAWRSAAASRPSPIGSSTSGRRSPGPRPTWTSS